LELMPNSATASILALGRRFLRFAQNSINALVDDLTGISAETHDWQVMIFVGHEIELLRRAKNGIERLGAFGTELSEGALARLQQRLSALPNKGVRLRFSSERAVMRLIALPASAQDVVGAIVRNKVESLAPWPLNEALWGFKRTEETAQPGQLGFKVGIIGRKQVEALINWLAAAGVKIAHLDIGDVDRDGGIEIDFLRENKTERIRRRIAGTMKALAFATAACAVVGAYFVASSLSELDQIETRTAELTGALRDQSASSGEGSKFSEARKLIERKRTEQPAITIIESLTRLVPNDAWIETLDYEDHHLTIVGRGAAIPPIVEALERSGVFSDVNFASPTQHDAVAKVDTFSISAAVQPQRGTQ
jgi:general secretion pathway protein L